MELSPEAIAYIQQNFPLTPVPLAPEIRIHKATPSSGVWRLAADERDGLPTPYWTSWWGGGVALARYVLDHPDIVSGKRALDLGAGSGIVAIAAAKAGAAHVLAIDIDRYAIAATRLNAAANGVKLSAQVADVLAGEPLDVDMVLVGDLFYDADLAQRSAAFLDRCVARGQRVLVGDPGREYLPRSRLRLLAKYDGADFGEANARVSAFEFT